MNALVQIFVAANKMKKNGLTMIELILYMGIVTLVLSAVVPVIWQIVNGAARSSTQEKMSSTARLVSERIKYEIRNAKGINPSSFGVNLVTSVGSTISLVQDAPNNPTVFDVLNGKVRIKKGAAAAVELNPEGTKVIDLTLINYSSADNKTKNIGGELTVVSDVGSSRAEYLGTVRLKFAAELRSN